MISLRYFIQKLYHKSILFSIFFTKKAIHLPLIESLRLLAIFLLKKFALKIRTNILKCNIQTSNENYISIVLTKDQNPLLVQQKMENKL